MTPASGSEPFSLFDGPAQRPPQAVFPGPVRSRWGAGATVTTIVTPSLTQPFPNLQSWYHQPEFGQSEANSPRSAKGIGLSMRTHCQTAVLLPYLAPMRGGIAIPGLRNFSIIESL